MTTVLKSLKVNFSDLYELLTKNQGPNGLIFFVPKTSCYQKDSLGDRNFYYSHIFQKSKYDGTLYVNMMGKVLKTIDNKRFFSFLGWTKDIKLNVKKTGTNEDNILYYQTDRICIEELISQDSISGKDSEATLEPEKFYSAEEYLEYYDNENFGKDNKKYQKAKEFLKKFILAMKMNNMLLKGQESSYSKMFQENAKNLISIFSSVFQNNDDIAKEYVDVFIFKDLYDYIMNKIKMFYNEEDEKFQNRIKDNLNKLEPEVLKLPKTIEKCDFTKVISGIKNLSVYKTSFEKVSKLVQIHNLLIELVKEINSKEGGEPISQGGDFFMNCWIYVIGHSNDNEVTNGLIAEALFLKYFLIRKGEEPNDYIINCFFKMIEWFKNEILQNENDTNIQIAKLYKIKASD